MTPRLMLMKLAFALVTTVTFAAAEGEEAAATEKEMVRDPSYRQDGHRARVWRHDQSDHELQGQRGSTPISATPREALSGWVNEKLGVRRLGDRPARGRLYHAVPARRGAHRATGRELGEPGSAYLHLQESRDGVFWHDKAPVNGRQLTAHDVAYSWQRLLFGVDGGESSPGLPRPGALTSAT